MRRPAPGHRPRAGVRFVAGVCPGCGATFILDRQVEGPWARARTCSTSCARIVGNRGRSAVSCAHCLMVDEYHDERHRQEAELEGLFRQDEDARGRVITFRRWLRHYPWAPPEVIAEWSTPRVA